MQKQVTYITIFIVVIILFYQTYSYSWPIPTIPHSGVTKCYDNEKEISCPKPGEAFYGQSGNYIINPKSYTKLDENGNDLPDDAKIWVMVRDNVTELIWKNYSKPHEAANEYT